MCDLYDRKTIFPVVKSEINYASDGLVKTTKISLPTVDQSFSYIRPASHTSVTHSPWINIREIRPHRHNNFACWIINLLLDVLLCSIAK